MITRRKTLATALAGASLALTLADPLSAQSAEDLKIGAMNIGSSWYVFGATLAEMLQGKLPEGTTVEVIARGGGVANPMVVEQGKAQIALANVATSVWARDGHEIYGGQKAENIRALVGGLNPVYVTALVTEDYVERTGNADLTSILTGAEPVRIVMKPAGSSVPPTADMIMAALGTSRADIEARGGKIIQVETAQIADVLRDGRADLYFETAVKGHPGLTEVTLTNDMRFLDLPPEAQDHLKANGLRIAEFGPWFEGQDGPTIGADLGTVLIAHKDLPEDTAYLITKTLAENADAMAEAHGAWSHFVPEEAGRPENVGIPLHPGAERYYEERGWL
jgi:TRAP transporter TAXI family solute receptor